MCTGRERRKQNRTIQLKCVQIFYEQASGTHIHVAHQLLLVCKVACLGIDSIYRYDAPAIDVVHINGLSEPTHCANQTADRLIATK